jgi:hypothetical protein
VYFLAKDRSGGVQRTGLLLFVALLVAFATPSFSGMRPIHVEGANLVTGNQPIRLRGIDWGWWHLSGTRYTEDDMRKQAAWGANVARLVFSYGDLEKLDKTDTWRDDGFKQFDDVIRWGDKYGVYTILDMHVAPGGQSNAPYTDGGRNKIWGDPQYQQRYIDLWKEIARRYRNRPEVAAYELMNEPDTRQPTDAALASLNRRAVAAIRTIDPNKVIVVTGDHMSSASCLTDEIKVDDPNIVYTFHFYDGASDRWVGNLKNGDGSHGTMPWTKIDETFVAPPHVSLLCAMLRSTDNSGDAWFDDVKLEDESGNTLLQSGFDTGPSGFQPERGPQAPMTYDPAVGHDKPGSLRVGGTVSYNGWTSARIRVDAGKTYRLSGWVKLDNATGDTYLSAAFFSDYLLPKAELATHLDSAIAFGRKYNVPLWVGEFGCEASVVPREEQPRWVRDCISLFEGANFNWTYWNYRETTGPDSMALHAEKKDGTDYPVNTMLLAALKDGWRLNGR